MRSFPPKRTHTQYFVKITQNFLNEERGFDITVDEGFAQQLEDAGVIRFDVYFRDFVSEVVSTNTALEKMWFVSYSLVSAVSLALEFSLALLVCVFFGREWRRRRKRKGKACLCC